MRFGRNKNLFIILTILVFIVVGVFILFGGLYKITGYLIKESYSYESYGSGVYWKGVGSAYNGDSSNGDGGGSYGKASSPASTNEEAIAEEGMGIDFILYLVVIGFIFVVAIVGRYFWNKKKIVSMNSANLDGEEAVRIYLNKLKESEL